MQKTQLESYKTPIINEQGANLSIKSVYYSWWHLFLSMSDANYIFKLWVVWGYPKDFFPTPSWNLGFSGGFLLKNPQNYIEGLQMFVPIVTLFLDFRNLDRF